MTSGRLTPYNGRPFYKHDMTLIRGRQLVLSLSLKEYSISDSDRSILGVISRAASSQNLDRSLVAKPHPSDYVYIP